MARQGSDSSGEERLGFEDLVASYVDRLNAGERLTPERILAEEPDLGPEILEHLRALVDADLELVGAGAARTFGDYTLRRQVGRGGMGLVYEAWQGSLDRRVALKVLPPGLAADTRACSRFLREAQIVAKLSHPSLVPVHGFGVESGTPYYAMDFIEGETLGQIVARMRAGGPSARTAFGPGREDIGFYAAVAGAFADVADGLQHAHARGVVHRDVKPSNLILETSAAPGPGVAGGAGGPGTGSGTGSGSGSSGERAPAARLRILDFGLARLEGQESLSVSGDLVGTPLYMSPEQARRRGVPVDHRTDVYSLGATLYEVLTLEPPFRGKDHEDTLSQILGREPRPPRQLNPRVPRDLETIVLKCLRKEVGERYGTAEALGQDLRRFVRGDPIEARAESRWDRARRRLRRRWRVLAVAAMVVALGLLAGLLALERGREDARRRDAEYDARLLGVAARIQLDAVTLRTAAGAPTLLDPEGVFELYQLFEKDTSLPGQGRASLEALLPELAALAETAPWRADAWFHRARAHHLLGRVAEAREDLRTALSRDGRFVPALVLLGRILADGPGESPRRRPAEEALASAGAPWVRCWLRAEDALASEDWPAVIEESGPLVADGVGYVGLPLEARLARGYARMRAGDSQGALEDLSYAKERWPGLLAPYMILAEVHGREGRREEAQRVLEEAWERTEDPRAAAIWASVFCARCLHSEAGLEWARRARTPNIEAHFLASLGREDDLRELSDRLLAANPRDVEALLHRSHLELQAAFRLGATPEGKRRMDRALAFVSSAIAIDPEHGFVNAARGQLMLLRGRRLEAEDAFAEERARHGDKAHVLGFVGFCYLQVGLYEDAEEAIRAELATGPRPGDAYGGLGHVALRMGRLEEAEGWLRKAIDANPVNPDWHGFLGQVYRRLGRPVEALRHLLRALDLPREDWSYWVGVGDCGGNLAGIFIDLDWSTLPGDVDEQLHRLEDASRAKPDATVLGALSLWRLRSPRWGDPERALAHAERAVELSRSRDPNNIAFRAHALRALGRAGESILDLERAVRIPWAARKIHEILEEERAAALPEVVSCVSADALADRLGTDPDAPRGVLPEAAARARAGGRPEVAGYLEALLLEREGDLAGAAEALRGVAGLADAPSEVVPRRAAVLLALSRPEESLAALEEGLRTRSGTDPALWRRWAKAALVDVGLSPPAALARLEALPIVEDPAAAAGRGDVAWLLGELSAGGPLRIDCGSTDDPAECPLWSRDRFFTGGYAPRPSFREVAATERGALYQTTRYFWDYVPIAGYSIPLPAGRWRVTLHFAELRQWEPGRRRFSVDGEGARILEGFDPAVDGILRANEAQRIVDVRDGMLDLAFVPETGEPLVSGIEVERADGYR